MSGMRRFGEVLRVPDVRPALLGACTGRLSYAMTGLAVLLLVKEATGSYGAAGVVSACYSLAFAVVSPLRARAADRHGARRVLRMSAVLQPFAFVLLVVLAQLHAPVVCDAVAAVLVGAAAPPVGGVMRALWADLVEPGALPVAYSLEAVAIELCFVVGPLLVAVLSGLAPPAVAVLTSAGLAAAGAWSLAQVPAVRRHVPHADRAQHVAGPLVSPVVRSTLLCVLFFGASFGAIEVGVLAFVEQHGHARSAAGAVLAVWSAGSALGGVVYGGLGLRADPARQLPVLAACAGLACALPLLAPGVVVLAVLLLLAGSTIAPYSAATSFVLGRAAPAGTTTEAFAWFTTLMFAGGSAGTAMAGVLADAHGSAGAFLTAAAAGVLATGAAALAVRVLRGSQDAPAHVAS